MMSGWLAPPNNALMRLVGLTSLHDRAAAWRDATDRESRLWDGYLRLGAADASPERQEKIDSAAQELCALSGEAEEAWRRVGEGCATVAGRFRVLRIVAYAALGLFVLACVALVQVLVVR